MARNTAPKTGTLTFLANFSQLSRKSSAESASKLNQGFSRTCESCLLSDYIKVELLPTTILFECSWHAQLCSSQYSVCSEPVLPSGSMERKSGSVCGLSGNATASQPGVYPPEVVFRREKLLLSSENYQGHHRKAFSNQWYVCCRQPCSSTYVQTRFDFVQMCSGRRSSRRSMAPR